MAFYRQKEQKMKQSYIKTQMTTKNFPGGEVEAISDTELISEVTFHGGDVELISDAELISDVTFHGGDVEQISDAELISDVTFHTI